MNENYAEKAYAAYRKISVNPFTKVTTTHLNVLYNILCRIRRDKAYRKALDEFPTDEGERLEVLIEKYFDGYNALHGVDIRETLTEFTDPDFAEGGFFILDTFRKAEDGTLVPHSPAEFRQGETAHVQATLYSAFSREPLRVPRLSAISLNDDAVSNTAEAEDCCAISFTVTLSRPGSVKFKVIPRDANGKNIPGLEIAYGGVIFSKDEILPTHKPPADLEEFWNGEIDRMLRVIPTDETVDAYTGSVIYGFDMASKNRHRIIPVDKDYLQKLRDNRQMAPKDSVLETHYIWDVNLKAPGPNPTTAYISVPRNAEDKSVPIHIIFDGYGVRCPSPCAYKDEIAVHCSHHGYELGHEDSSYYQILREEICTNYGRGNGKINAGYADIHDCYMTYLLLRDLQVIRYCVDPMYSSELTLLHDKWNGKIIISGSSMGGYQTVCIGALTALLKKKTPPFEVIRLSPSVPAFCNIAGPLDNRVPTYLTTYEEGMDYYDAALLAHLIDAPLCIPRIGLGDETCPPTGILAMYNSIPATVSKSVHFLQNSSHGYIPDTDVQRWYKY
ncbi:MAG: hypothetical protein E7662_08150 [Ruminococcaceae bacterium]|nr:hypothetical protein [Oscillospiraceae bacterium]